MFLHNKTITAIILNYFSANETLRLCSQIKSSAGFVNILVIDNSADIAEEEKLFEKQKCFDHIIINEKNLGYAGGNNIGIQYALDHNADYIIILNPDIELFDNIFSGLIQKLELDDNLIAVGPRLCYFDKKSIIYSDGGFIPSGSFYKTKHLHYNKSIKDKDSQANVELSFLSGSFFIINAKFINKVGLFNERFFLYFEETEWFLRAKSLGYTFSTVNIYTAYIKSSVKGYNYHFYMTRNRLWINWLYDKKNFKYAVFDFLKEQLIRTKYLILFKKNIWHAYFGRLNGFFKALFTKPI